MGRPSDAAAALAPAADFGSSPAAPSLPVLADRTASSGPATDGTDATRALSSLLAATNGLPPDHDASERRTTDETDAFFSTLARLQGDTLLDLFV